MRIVKLIAILVASAAHAACTVMTSQQSSTTELQQAVANTERAFAKSMADRDHAAFSAFLSDEAVFFSGPVRDAQGKLIATFASVWRQEAPSVWRIVFDKGNEVCDCRTP